MGQNSLPAKAGSVVHFRGLKKSFAKPVFQNADLTLEKGQFYALLGKNGSGKSTLIRILAHRESAEADVGTVLGVELEQDFCEKANTIGFISEATIFQPHLQLSEILELQEKLFKNWSSEEKRRLADGFHLDLTKRAGELSRGQLVQFGLVLNLSYNPELILLDEVTAVLDARVRNFLMQELSARVKKGATVLLATNIVTEVQNYATSLVLLGNKGIKVNAPISEIAREFVKLERIPEVECSSFSQDNCIEVGLTNSGTPVYLLPKVDALSQEIPPSLLSKENITPVEIFVYLTRLRD